MDGWNLHTNERVNGKGEAVQLLMVRPQERKTGQVCEPSPKRAAVAVCTACLSRSGCDAKSGGMETHKQTRP